MTYEEPMQCNCPLCEYERWRADNERRKRDIELETALISSAPRIPMARAVRGVATMSTKLPWYKRLFNYIKG